MQFVAKHGLPFRRDAPKGRTSGGPVIGRRWHAGELDDGHGQAVDGTLAVVRQVKPPQHSLPHQIEAQRQGLPQVIDDHKHPGVWCLGNARTTMPEDNLSDECN